MRKKERNVKEGGGGRERKLKGIKPFLRPHTLVA
jgi:hypothetical protein